MTCGLVKFVVALRVVQLVVVLNHGPENFSDEIWRVHQTLWGEPQMLIHLHVDQFVALEIGPVTIMYLTGVNNSVIQNFVVNGHFSSTVTSTGISIASATCTIVVAVVSNTTAMPAIIASNGLKWSSTSNISRLIIVCSTTTTQSTISTTACAALMIVLLVAAAAIAVGARMMVIVVLLRASTIVIMLLIVMMVIVVMLIISKASTTILLILILIVIVPLVLKLLVSFTEIVAAICSASPAILL